jgi:hypothetical protein
MVTATHTPAAAWAAAHRLLLAAVLFTVVLAAAAAVTWGVARGPTTSMVDVPQVSTVDDRCAEVGPGVPC